MQAAPATALAGLFVWRREAESNRSGRICNPLHNRFAIAPSSSEKGKLEASLFGSGAGEESRTLDLNLGKVALYQLSYSRIEAASITEFFWPPDRRLKNPSGFSRAAQKHGG
jgi:hypothetical protein